MGKRKNTKPPPKKSARALPTVFPCPFCNSEKSCKVKINMAQGTGTVACKMCRESFTTVTNILTEPIDVYTEWTDECRRVNAPLADEAATIRDPDSPLHDTHDADSMEAKHNHARDQSNSFGDEYDDDTPLPETNIGKNVFGDDEDDDDEDFDATVEERKEKIRDAARKKSASADDDDDDDDGNDDDDDDFGEDDGDTNDHTHFGADDDDDNNDNHSDSDNDSDDD